MPVDDKPSLAELARRGADRADEQRAADAYKRDHVREAVEAKALEKTREHARVLIYQSRPWIQLARVAGWAGLAVAPMGWAMVLLYRGGGPRISAGQHVAAWSFAIGGTLVLPLLFLRSRMLAGAIARESARIAPYHIKGWFEALGNSWDSMSRFGRGSNFGEISMLVTLATDTPPIELLENAVGAIVPDSKVTGARGGFTITSPTFYSGASAYDWSCAIVDRLLPSIDRDARVAHVRVNREHDG